jgi:hypothetical protein
LRDVHLRRRAGEVALFRDCDEVLERTQLHS